MVRAIAASAYLHGAKFVDVQYFDPWVKRARVEHAREEDLDFIPDWHGKRLLALGEIGAARVGLSGPIAPGLIEDLDPARVGRDRFPALKEAGKVVNDRTTNWTIAPCPTPAWAKLVFPDLPDAEALERLEAAPAARLPPRRGRPGRGLARARGLPRRDRRAPDRAPLRRAALRGPGHRPDRRAAARPLAGRPRASRASTGSCTCRTCRRRRSSPRPTPRASTARSPRRSRSC